MVISRMIQKAELKSQDTNWSNHMLFSPYPILNAKNANRSIRKWPKSIGLIVYNVKNVRAFDAIYRMDWECDVLFIGRIEYHGLKDIINETNSVLFVAMLCSVTWTWAISIQIPSTTLYVFHFQYARKEVWMVQTVLLLLLCLVILMLMPWFCLESNVNTHYQNQMCPRKPLHFLV